MLNEAHFNRPPPAAQEIPQAGLRQLLSKKMTSGYMTEDIPGQVVAYQRALLSFPRDQQHPVPLDRLLPAKESNQLTHFEEDMVFNEEIAEVLESGFRGNKYLDPILENDVTEYYAFVADLFQIKLLDFTVSLKSK